MTPIITKYLAMLGFGFALLATGYGVGYTDHKNKVELDSVKNQLRIEQQDAVQAQKDELVIQEYVTQVQELQNALSDQSRICFDDIDAGRLRQLWAVPG